MQTQEVIRGAVRPGMSVIFEGHVFKAVRHSGKFLYLSRFTQTVKTSDIFLNLLVDSRNQPVTQ